MDSTGPGPHKFHGACVNGAFNFVALTQDVGGQVGRMMVWSNAEKAGIKHPFPPFGKQVRPNHVTKRNRVVRSGA